MTNSEPEWPSERRAWITVVIFTIAYVISFVDRQILTLLIDPIQTDLGLSDFQISLLIGASFAIFYAAAGVPIGYLVDRMDRRLLAATGVAFWSIMTGLCGMASNFFTLFLARMGVGVGEATLSPAAYSIFADSLRPDKLVRAVGVYSSGAVIGIGLAYVIGGEIVAWSTRTETVDLILVGTIKGWQAPFFLLVLPGLLIALMVGATNEPQRRKTTIAEQPAQGPSKLLAFFKTHGTPVLLIFIGMGFQAIVVQSILSWGPSILVRRFGWTADNIGWTLGIGVLALGLFSNLLSALIGSHFVAKGRPERLLGICILGSIGLLLIAPLGPAVTSPFLAAMILVGGFAVGVMATTPAISTLQLITPSHLRGRVTALFLLVSQLIGLTFGPILVAVFTEQVFQDRAAVAQAQAATAGIGAIVSLAVFSAGYVYVRKAFRNT